MRHHPLGAVVTGEVTGKEGRTMSDSRTTGGDATELVRAWDDLALGLVVIDRDWRYRYVNPAAAGLLGRSAASLVGRDYRREFPDDAGSAFELAYRRVLATGVPETVDNLYEPWDRWFRSQVLPCRAGITVLFSDVTAERRHSLSDIADLAVLTQLVNRAPVGVTVKDADGRFLYVNAAAARQAASDPAEMVGRDVGEVYAPSVATASRETTAEVARTRRSRTTEEVVPVDGLERTYLSTRFPVYQASGDLLGVAAIHTDISEQKTAERELAASRALYRDIFAGTTLGQCVASGTTHRVLECNDAFAALLGGSVEQVLASDTGDLVVDPEGWAAGLGAAVEAGRRSIEVDGELRRFDGRAVPVLASATVLNDGSTVSFIVRDLSPVRELQARLVESERLEAVGAVAGGIAHDVNNVLAAVGGYADLLEPHVPATGSPARHLAGIHRAVARARDLVDRLLAFSRQQELEPTTFDLGAAVHDLADMCRRLLPGTVRLELGVLPVLPVRADHAQVQQVVLNLVLNARDALPDGGTVVVTGHEAPGGDADAASLALARGHELRATRYAAVSVSDDGVGMSEPVLRRCFEPFFTTRHGRGGHGLGLSTAFGIARQSGGDLRVSSREGVGTTFTLLLPLAPDGGADPGGTRGSSPDAGPDQDAPPAPAGPGPTTLVVDDDPDVLDVVAATLRAAGHTVLEAADGDKALLLARAMGPSLDLVVSDVHMPGTDGRTLRARLARERPDLPVLLVSGRGEEVDGPFLAKPFRPRALLAAVRELLAP
ncbi:PAS domain-containing protein [Aquipuribacter sp. SD81]|uniref:PAS domain-containing protein n=1 Tax=Aquipuribacter sp. SD81 TaxID=3127703 RepID=UPI003015CA17